ncbi:MAG: hypothetical protein HY074_11685, partial [Deltaproteobacteria bacterium]|nr:hypothetical protein [Deltaproteobacteria bacterium]
GRFPGDDSALSHIKMFAVEKGFAAATLFCELFGTLGYGAHHPSQKLLRDLLGLKFLGGTKEQHKMTIFMTLFGALAQNEQKSAKAA